MCACVCVGVCVCVCVRVGNRVSVTNNECMEDERTMMPVMQPCFITPVPSPDECRGYALCTCRLESLSQKISIILSLLYRGYLTLWYATIAYVRDQVRWLSKKCRCSRQHKEHLEHHIQHAHNSSDSPCDVAHGGGAMLESVLETLCHSRSD